ncbi:transcription initiation factor iib-related [Anaeramoeba flamelloides]|uniref:Transcription initiation factor iib-related n=1 Tax=Anaeramoeba flamelloides TaxID=1746091 RepID=A0AAV7YC51_9EUKA|nr:transcription initiation factor iib-related [Anaeramoeba flamelloides]|eukprot:Anaeramoba_flamelloidesa327774_58.p1 GENE.a327774_58~~a327774_58.p1  ORF type:complete len:346 (+),score=65.02 a327774_58:75-1112(+)
MSLNQDKINQLWKKSRGQGWFCTRCNSRDIIQDMEKGIKSCRSCGHVIATSIIFEGAEYRQFKVEHGSQDRSRVGGSNEMDLNVSLSTSFASGGKGGGMTYYQDGGLGKAQQRSVSSRQRNLTKGYSEINTIGKTMGLPDRIREKAKYLFKDVRFLDKIKRKKSKTVATAVISYVCREAGVGRSMREMCAVSGLSRKEIGKVYRAILSYKKGLGQKTPSVTLSAPQLMVRFCETLGMSFPEQTLCEKVAQAAIDKAIEGSRHADSIAAGVIFLVVQMCNIQTKKPIRLSDIADAIGVAESTVRDIYNEIYPKRLELFPKNTEFKDKDPKQLTGKSKSKSKSKSKK